MALDYLHKGECCVTMYDYLDRTLDAFDEATKKHRDGWILVTKRHSKKMLLLTISLLLMKIA